MKVLFHENQLSYRGTSVAVYDYADFNEKLLGNTSIIIYNRNNPYNDLKAIERFKNRFKVLSYESLSEFNRIIESEKPDFFYAIKRGDKDAIVSNVCKTGVHVVFKYNEPHGDVYTYVSEWLAKEMGGENTSFVPHIVHLPIIEESLHSELSIPKNSRVFGWYGGNDSFDIKFVQRTIERIALRNPNIFFIFMGVDDFTKRKYFWQRKKIYKNIIFLPPNTDTAYKVKFINTCDAMIHARSMGETFGLAVGEFAIKGKAIIAYKNPEGKAHLDIMKEKGYYYTNSKELEKILFSELEITPRDNYKQFSPENVMQKFKKIFLDT